MRILVFIVAVLLMLIGGGCMITWLAEGAPTERGGGAFIVLFGVLPVIGGVLLFRFARDDRGTGGDRRECSPARCRTCR